MVFSSLKFIFLFLPVFFAAYFLLARINTGISKVVLVAASVFFYCFTSYKLAFYLVGAILINTLIAYILSKNKSKVLLGLGVILNVCILLFFKYSNFFIESINSIFKTQYNLLNVFAPLGISFITFKFISSLVDIYKHESCKLNLLNYINYVSFFPQVVSGPISCFYIMDEAFSNDENYRFNTDSFSRGLFLFSSGLVKKVLIAGSLVLIETTCLVERSVENSTLALMGVIAYSLEIYFDFSGYSDMANGICCMINIPITKNFDSPYHSTSISDFWKRWHISLTSFLTKYIYIPLGGNRKGIVRTYVNIFMVFLISGIWHGAAWTFILWGVLNGLIMIVERVLQSKFKIRLPKIIGRIYSFTVVSVLWLIFRCESLHEVVMYLKEIAAFKFTLFPGEIQNIFATKGGDYLLSLLGVNSVSRYFPYLWILAALVICMLPKNSDELALTDSFSKRIWPAVGMAFLAFVSVVSMSTVSSFIYWTF